jgi:hypothetical protein
MNEVDGVSCQEAAERLPWLLNGTLGDEESRSVREHVRGCAACRRELEEVRQAARVFGAHLPAQTLVDLAWDRAIAPADADLARRHLESCAACADELALVRASRQAEAESAAAAPMEHTVVPFPIRAARRPALARYAGLAASVLIALLAGVMWRTTRPAHAPETRTPAPSPTALATAAVPPATIAATTPAATAAPAPATGAPTNAPPSPTAAATAPASSSGSESPDAAIRARTASPPPPDAAAGNVTGGSAPVRPLAGAFVVGRTSAASAAAGKRASGSAPEGFEGGAGIGLRRPRASLELSGAIDFEVRPTVPAPGEKYSVSIRFRNDGTAPIAIRSLTVAVTIDAKKTGPMPVPAQVQEVAPRGTEVLLDVSEIWKDDVTSWVMEVFVTTARGEVYSNTVTWRPAPSTP